MICNRHIALQRWILIAVLAAIAAAGLPRQRFHDLRHAAASFILAQGVSLTDVQRVQRHSSIAITNDIYGHITVYVTRAATAPVEALLGQLS